MSDGQVAEGLVLIAQSRKEIIESSIPGVAMFSGRAQSRKSELDSFVTAIMSEYIENTNFSNEMKLVIQEKCSLVHILTHQTYSEIYAINDVKWSDMVKNSPKVALDEAEAQKRTVVTIPYRTVFMLPWDERDSAIQVTHNFAKKEVERCKTQIKVSDYLLEKLKAAESTSAARIRRI